MRNQGKTKPAWHCTLSCACGETKNSSVICMVLQLYIMLTCPCNKDPLTSHFCIIKLVFTGIFNEAVLTCTLDLCFEQK